MKELDNESESDQIISSGSCVNTSLPQLEPAGDFEEQNFYQVEVVPNEEFWNQFSVQKSKSRSKTNASNVEVKRKFEIENKD